MAGLRDGGAVVAHRNRPLVAEGWRIPLEIAGQSSNAIHPAPEFYSGL